MHPKFDVWRHEIAQVACEGGVLDRSTKMCGDTPRARRVMCHDDCRAGKVRCNHGMARHGSPQPITLPQMNVSRILRSQRPSPSPDDVIVGHAGGALLHGVGHALRLLAAHRTIRPDRRSEYSHPTQDRLVAIEDLNFMGASPLYSESRATHQCRDRNTRDFLAFEKHRGRLEA